MFIFCGIRFSVLVQFCCLIACFIGIFSFEAHLSTPYCGLIVHVFFGGASDVNICGALVMSGCMFQLILVCWYDLHDLFACFTSVVHLYVALVL